MDLTSGQHPLPDPFEGCRLLPGVQFPPSKKELAKAYSEYELLHKDMERFLSRFDLSAREKGELLSDLPTSWERHGDLIVLPNTAFTRAKWSQLSSPAKDGDSPPQAPLVPNGHIWKTVASALKCNRLAIYNRVKSDKFRSSGTTLLLGKDGWVEHTDNGIKYVFDVTKVMFSSGNITEKLRIASFNCKGETVLDLYAGIGYFTLPYLVHARAKMVHACEWNSHAVEALERSLEANGVKERCMIHCEDNRKV